MKTRFTKSTFFYAKRENNQEKVQYFFNNYLVGTYLFKLKHYKNNTLINVVEVSKEPRA